MVILGARFSDSQIVVGSVLDKVSSERLVICPYHKRVVFSRESSPSVQKYCNLCSLDGEICSVRGRRFKFKPCFDGVRVSWLCSKLVGLPNPES